jgi:hypothetical protein
MAIRIRLSVRSREGIAKVLTDNILFGDDIGEFASNRLYSIYLSGLPMVMLNILPRTGAPKR